MASTAGCSTHGGALTRALVMSQPVDAPAVVLAPQIEPEIAARPTRLATPAGHGGVVTGDDGDVVAIFEPVHVAHDQRTRAAVAEHPVVVAQDFAQAALGAARVHREQLAHLLQVALLEGAAETSKQAVGV